MNLQPIFSTVFIAGWAVAFGAGLVGVCQRFTGRRHGKAVLVFFCGWIVAAADGLLAWALGYHP
jgi:hypothetical protein